jgi:8-oxo-dGTP pyrophosphatase MutT (NUDIX family)
VAPPFLTRLVQAVDALPEEQPVPWYRPPTDGRGRESAVLIALSETATGAGVLMIERALGLRTHSGQAAFPGGGAEAEDAGPAATALREAQEEVGLDSSSVRVLTSMPRRYLPPSGFIVTPVIAWWRHPHPVAAVDLVEVARAVVLGVEELADPANRFQVAREAFVSPAFEVDGLFVWGFTAGLLAELITLGGWERPWDHADIRPLPGPPTPPLPPVP